MGAGWLSNERMYLRTHFGQLFRRHAALRLGIPAAPINALHLICQNRIRRRAADENLKRIVLDLRRQRTADHQARLAVIRRRTQNEGRAMPCLFMASLRREVDPHDLASIRHVLLCHHQTSLPCGGPKSTASCRFFALIPFSSSSRAYVFCRTGSMTIRPFSSRTSTTSSRSRCMASITEAGILTAALLPHFFTVAFMTASAASTLYIHYDIRRGMCQQCRDMRCSRASRQYHSSAGCVFTEY